MKKRSLIVLLCLFTIGLAACGNSSNVYDNNDKKSYELEDANESVDSAIYNKTVEAAITMAEQLMQENSVPGMTIAFVDAQRDFTWTHSLGFADTENNNIPVTEDTLFSIASISKPFTAIAVMQLVEAGLIDLDEPLVTYLPDFSMLPNPALGGDYENITVRMLLSHTSGIYPDFLGNNAFTADEQYEGFLNQLVDFLSNQNMISEEGTVFTYSNSGFDLLGVLIATVSGYDNVFEGFVNYTNEHIFAPAGMTRSTFGMTDELLAYYAKPYRDAETQEEMVFPNGLAGAGMFSTANDMATFMHILLDGGSFDGGQLLTSESLAGMMQTHDFDFSGSMGGMTYGLGFMQRTNFEGFPTVGHGGTLPYYHSELVIDAESGIGVFVTVNSSSGISVSNQVAEGILQNAIYEKTRELNRAPSVIEADAVPVSLSAEVLKPYEGFYQLIGERVATIHLGDYDELIFSQRYPFVEDMVLTPMSDGSFTNPTLGYLWFDEIGGEIAIFESEFKTLAGFRGDIEPYLINEDLRPWFGSYYAIPNSEKDVPLISRIDIGVDEFDVAIARLLMPHLNPITPIFAIDGVWYFGGEPLDFTLDDGVASFEIQGMRFEKEVAS